MVRLAVSSASSAEYSACTAALLTALRGDAASENVHEVDAGRGMKFFEILPEFLRHLRRRCNAYSNSISFASSSTNLCLITRTCPGS